MEGMKMVERGNYQGKPVKKVCIKSGEKYIEYVPVVRCKDCKHWYDGICKNGFGLAFNGENDFCSYGERKPK
jgi:hypothetical protein